MTQPTLLDICVQCSLYAISYITILRVRAELHIDTLQYIWYDIDRPSQFFLIRREDLESQDFGIFFLCFTESLKYACQDYDHSVQIEQRASLRMTSSAFLGIQFNIHEVLIYSSWALLLSSCFIFLCVAKFFNTLSQLRIIKIPFISFTYTCFAYTLNIQVSISSTLCKIRVSWYRRRNLDKLRHAETVSVKGHKILCI